MQASVWPENEGPLSCLARDPFTMGYLHPRLCSLPGITPPICSIRKHKVSHGIHHKSYIQIWIDSTLLTIQLKQQRTQGLFSSFPALYLKGYSTKGENSKESL